MFVGEMENMSASCSFRFWLGSGTNFSNFQSILAHWSLGHFCIYFRHCK